MDRKGKKKDRNGQKKERDDFGLDRKIMQKQAFINRTDCKNKHLSTELTAKINIY
jgi:hypothetical protein